MLILVLGSFKFHLGDFLAAAAFLIPFLNRLGMAATRGLPAILVAC